MNRLKLTLISAVVGVVLNILLAEALSPLATPAQRQPPEGAASLDPLGQFMHMIVHHKQVLGMSSFIVFVIVALAVAIAQRLPSKLV
jgi:hypothetical protein